MLIKLYSYLFIFLALTTVGTWLSINWWAPNLTIAFIQWIVCFVLLIYPTFKYQHIKILCRYNSYKLFNIFNIYTFSLSLYAIMAYTSSLERSDLAALLSCCLAMLSCLSIYTLSFPNWLIIACRRLYKYLPLIAIVYMPFAKPHAFGDLLGFVCMPAMLLLIFFKELPKKQKYIWFILTILIVVSSFIDDARSNVIKYAFCFLLGITINWDNFYRRIKHLIWFFFIMPIVLFFLGVFNIFNIFAIDTYFDSESLNEETIADTRTLVYQEVLLSAIDNDYIVTGRGIGKGYESLFQQRRAEGTMSVSNTTDVNASERQSEAGILNIFTWGGIIYVVIYTLFYMSVVYYGIYKSKNRFSRNAAIFLAFYYFYSWVENFQSFSIIYLSSYLFIVMSISPYFREMNNNEVKQYIYKLLK